MFFFSLLAVWSLLMDPHVFSLLAVWPLALACYEWYIYIIHIYIYLYIVGNMPLMLKGCGAVCPLIVFRL